jgi:hypothetical protein
MSIFKHDKDRPLMLRNFLYFMAFIGAGVAIPVLIWLMTVAIFLL